MSVTDYVKAPSEGAVDDKESVDKQYRYWRIRIFYSMYVGYAFFYFTRKSFTFAMPGMMADLGLTKAQLGGIGSVLAITYGLSKFISGIMADKSNPRYFMGFGLILTGILNICFGMSSTLVALTAFWALNGWFQGWGWPPCAKLLTHWYSRSERGRWWGISSTSHNVGGALIPILIAFCMASYGWRIAMYVPGVLCIGVGLFLINRLRDTPESMGLPEVETWRDEEVKETSDVKKLPVKEMLLKYVLKNPYIWILASSYFFVYVLRTAINDWMQVYLYEEKGYSLLGASSGVFWFEVGGFVGMLVAGWASDKIFQGRRGPINVVFCFGILACLMGMWAVPPSQHLLVFALMFSVGFFVFGPQMLIGMAASELAHKKAAGTANGFVGWFAYLGAAVAGGPLGYVAEEMGWNGFFTILAVCGIISIMLLLPLWNARTTPKVSS